MRSCRSIRLRQLPGLLALLAIIAMVPIGVAAAWAAAVEGGYVYTGQTGAQTFINRSATSSFYLQATDTLELLGANLRMKRDPGAIAPLTFTLFAPDKSTVLASKTLTAVEFCHLHGGDCSSFDQVYFRFDDPYPLKPGLAYYATLTSPAAKTQTYFIKGADNCSVKTGGGVTVSDAKCSSNPPPASPALSVRKAGPTSVRPGQQVTYTLTVTNSGSGNATGAQIKDRLPADVTYSSFSGSGWSCSAVAGLVTCNYTGTIGVTAPGNTKSVTVTGVVANPVSSPTLENVASTDATGGRNAIDPENCTSADLGSGVCASATTDVTPGGPYLDVVVSDPDPPLREGEESTYTITITNHGDTPTSDPVEVYNYIPDGADLIDAGGDGWTCDRSNLPRLDCNHSDPIDKEGDPDDTTSFPITIKVPEETPGGTTYTDTSFVPRSGGDIDPPPTNPNNCTSTSTVACDANSSETRRPGFTTEKSSPRPPLQVGEQSTYVITVSTDSARVAAEVKDQLPAGLTFVPGSSGGSGWNCSVDNNNLVTCLKTISSGSSQQVPITVVPDASIVGTTVTNYASSGPVGAAPEPGPGCEGQDCDFSPGEVSPAATFSLTKSAPQPELRVNQQSVYQLTVTTASSASSVPVEIKDQLPQGMRFVQAGGGWSCSIDSANLLTCAKDMTGGSTETLGVTVEVTPELNNKTVVNYGSASTDGRAPPPGESCTPEGTKAVCAKSPAAKVADIREEIKTAVEEDVQAYLGAQLSQLIDSFGSDSRLQRFRDTACGVSHDMSLGGEATSHNTDLSANGTFSMKGGIVPTADVAEQSCGRFNIWAEANVGYVDGLQDSSATGGVATVGAEYLVTENFLAGVRLSMDYIDTQFDSAANSDISGFGWLAGPYVSAEIVSNVFLDGFIGYGTSWNDYDGKYENLALSGDFTAQRIAGYLNLSGNWQSGDVLLTPMVGVSYGKTWSDSFDVKNSIVGNTSIDSQEASLGQIKGRVEAGYLVIDDMAERFELFLAPQVTYDMVRDAGPEANLLLGDGLWHGGLEGGFRYAKDRFGTSLLVGYDGIGESDWNAYRGELQLNYSW